MAISALLETTKKSWEDSLNSQNLSAENLYEEFVKTVDTIQKQVIPNFFIQEYDAIHEIYERGSDSVVSLNSLDLPMKEFAEYEKGIRPYVTSIMERGDAKPTESERDLPVETATKNSLEFVSLLFKEDVNPKTEKPYEEGLECLDRLIDFRGTMEAYKEDALEYLSSFSEKGVDCQEDLAGLYFKSKMQFVLEYVNACLDHYTYYKELCFGGSEEPDTVKIV